MAETTTTNEPVYTNAWFADYIEETWERKLRPKHAAFSKYLEIGVCEGQSMRWVLQRLLTGIQDFAVGVDNYQPKKPALRKLVRKQKANRAHNLEPWNDRHVIIEQESGVALRTHPLLRDAFDEFDLIYVDGSHIAVDALEDLVLSWRLLRRGGYLIIDDFHRPVWHGRPMTNTAARAWMECVGSRIREVFRIGRPEHPEGEPRQVAFVKRR